MRQYDALIPSRHASPLRSVWGIAETDLLTPIVRDRFTPMGHFMKTCPCIC